MTDMEIRRATVEAAQQAINDAWNPNIPVARTLSRTVDRFSDIAREMRGAETGGSSEPQNGPGSA